MRYELIILNSKDRKLILKDLREMFSIEKLPEVIYFCFNKKEKVYIATREIFEMQRDELRVNMFGMYFGKIMKDGFRLSLEGLNLVKDQIKTNIFNLTTEQFREWILGRDIEVENEEDKNTYLIMKYQKDFVGVGKLKNNNIINYLPKSRKLQKVIL